MNDEQMTIDAEPAEPTTSTDLTVIRAALPTIIGADKNDLLGKLAAKIRAFQPDISTRKGQDAVRSLAAEVASTKMDLIRLGKGLTEGWRSQTAAVNAECKVIEERMDALKAQVRQPLTDFENAEKARVAANEAAIAAIKTLTIGVDTLSADEIHDRFQSIQPFEFSLEFQARAKRTLDDVTAQLGEAHQTAKERERLAEEVRKQTHRRWIDVIRRSVVMELDAPTALDYRVQIDRLSRIPSRNWEEFQAEAHEAYRETHTALVTAMDEALAAEAAVQAEREKQLRADAAAEATRRAEEAAARKAEEDAQAAQALLDAAAERERLATAHAKEIADRAEADRKRSHTDALDVLRRLGTLPVSEPPSVLVAHRIESLDEAFDREWEEFGDDAASAHAQSREALTKALDAATATETAREIALKEAEIRRREEAEQTAQREAQAKADAAVEAERQKVAREKAAEAEAAAKRAANTANQRRVNREGAADIVAVLQAIPKPGPDEDVGLDEIAKAIVTALAKGSIRHCKIDYSGE